jgi:hypothetical protein
MADFSIELDATLDLSISEIWPDGDAPENPTVADVVAVLEKHGSVTSVLSDWGFDAQWRVYQLQKRRPDPIVAERGPTLFGEEETR